VSEMGTSLKSGYFSAILLSGMKVLADRHRGAAYHNKHWTGDMLFSGINIEDLE